MQASTSGDRTSGDRTSADRNSADRASGDRMSGDGTRQASEPDPFAVYLTDLAVTLASRAGELAQERRSAGLTVSTKSSSTDVVTDADQAVEQYLIAQLRELRPDDAVLGEEGGAHPLSADPRSGDEPRSDQIRWVIDPIDGTVNFLLGLAQYAVSIAAVQGSVTLAGSVFNPVSKDLFSATRGGGSYLNGRRLGGPRRVDLNESVIATGFSYDRQQRVIQARLVAELMPVIGNLRRLGSAALDLCSVAAGWVDGYFEAGTHEWDHAAGLLIAEEAGAVTSGLHGRPPGEWMVAAAGPAMAEDFFAALTELHAAPGATEAPKAPN